MVLSFVSCRNHVDGHSITPERPCMSSQCFVIPIRLISNLIHRLENHLEGLDALLKFLACHDMLLRDRLRHTIRPRRRRRGWNRLLCCSISSIRATPWEKSSSGRHIGEDSLKRILAAGGGRLDYVEGVRARLDSISYMPLYRTKNDHSSVNPPKLPA